MRKIMMAAALAAGTAMMATPAPAQLVQAPAGLVVVNLGDITLTDILSSNDIDVLNKANILSGNQVAVPVSIAAVLCGTQVGVLAQQKSRTGGCTADSDNGGVDQLQKWLKNRARRAD